MATLEGVNAVPKDSHFEAEEEEEKEEGKEEREYCEIESNESEMDVSAELSKCTAPLESLRHHLQQSGKIMRRQS